MRRLSHEAFLRHFRPLVGDLIAGLTWPGIIVVCLVLAATLAGGFLVGLRGFAVNLLAGIVGLIVAIVAGILFIDRLPDRRRERTWQLVRRHTLEMLHAHLVSFAACCAISAGEAVPEELLNAPDDAPAAATGSGQWLRQLANRTRVLSRTRAMHDRILAATRDDLGVVTGELTRTVISLSSDTTLVDRLSELGNRSNRLLLLLSATDVQEDPSFEASAAIADTLDAGAYVLDYIGTELEISR